MIPVFCCGMPCLIRVLARASRPTPHTEGATESDIDAIPTIVLSSSNMASVGVEDMSCSICLNEMVVGESVKKVSCKHLFHQVCLDEWLLINNSCPSCRQKPSSNNTKESVKFALGSSNSNNSSRDNYELTSSTSTRIRSNSRTIV